MKNKNISIYVHWPFCTSKCPYCDFNSHIKRVIDNDEWVLAFTTELHYLFKKYFKEEESYTLKSIFFGGGTPSLMDPAIVKKIIKESKNLFNQNENIEITLEANPGSIFKDKLIDFFYSGINRISIGVQSFDKKSLQFLGRDHSIYDSKIKKHSFHIFSIKVGKNKRNLIQDKLKKYGIETNIHYPYSLSKLNVFNKKKKKTITPIANKISNQLLSLPIYPELKYNQLIYITNILNNIFNK